ncbi:MAG: YfhO family protein [Pseudomonadota bacterium]
MSREVGGAFLYLVALHALFYHAVFQGGLVYGSDTILTGYPALSFAHHFYSISGHVPYWNPFSDCGAPFLTSFPWITLYPPVRWALALPPVLLLNLVPILHSVFGSVTLYLALRTWALGSTAGLVGSTLFAFAGRMPLFLYAGHLNALFVIQWTPLLVLFWGQFFRTGRAVFVTLAGIALGLQILAGYHQYVLLIHLLLIPFILFGFQGSLKSKLLHLGQYLAIGVSMSAIQWLPLWLAHEGSVRGFGLSWDYLLQYSVAPRAILSLFVPNLFGDGVREPFLLKGTFVWETTAYFGLTTLPFALASLRLRKQDLLLLGTALLFVLLSMGETFPALYKLVTLLVPPLRWFRAPGRFLAPAFFLYIFFVVRGVELFFPQKPSLSPASSGFRTKALFLLLLLAILSIPAVRVFWTGDDRAATLNPFPILIAISTALLVTFLLGGFGAAVRKTTRYACLFLIVMDLFAASGRYYTVTSLKRFAPLSFSFGSWRVLSTDKAFKFESQAPLHQIYNAGGIEALLPAPYNDFLNAAGQNPPETNQAVLNARGFPPVMSLASVRWIIADRFHPSFSRLVPTANSGPYRIFENPEAFPRAFFIRHVIGSSDRDETLRLMLTSYGKFHDLALVQNPWEETEFQKPAENPYQTRALPDEIAFSLPGSPGPTFLVLTDSYADGWEARVDGRPTQIYRTNWWMRGILLPPGSRSLLLRYQPPGLGVGRMITWTAVAISTLLLLIGFATRPRRLRVQRG